MTENLNFQCFNLKELSNSNFKCSEIKIIDLRHPEETAISQLKITEFEVINIPYFALRKSLNILDRNCLLYTSPSPRDLSTSRMPSSA